MNFERLEKSKINIDWKKNEIKTWRALFLI